MGAAGLSESAEKSGPVRPAMRVSAGGQFVRASRICTSRSRLTREMSLAFLLAGSSSSVSVTDHDHPVGEVYSNRCGTFGGTPLNDVQTGDRDCAGTTRWLASKVDERSRAIRKVA